MHGLVVNNNKMWSILFVILQDREILFCWRGVKFYFVLMAWIDYPTYYAKVLDNRQVYDKQHLLVNSRLPVVRYRTITTRTIYYTVCTLYRTTIVAVSSTLSRSILYHVEIVGNYLHSGTWSVYKLFTIIYKIYLIKL